MLKLVNQKFTWAVLVTLAVFIILRFWITDERWAHGAIVTVGLFLAQHFEQVKMKPSEHLWTMFMLVFAFFSTTILSTTLFVSLVDNRVVGEINSLEDLAASGLTVYVSDPSDEDSLDLSKYIQ